MLSRADQSLVANWWWTIDRFLLATAMMLMALGIFLSFAASPAVAVRLGIADHFHFVRLHVQYTMLALLGMMGLSFLSQRQILLFVSALLIVSLALMGLVLLTGVEIKGARRWIVLFGTTIQPSEFVKPAFVVVSAFLFSQTPKWGKRKAWGSVFCLLIFTSILLVMEPDIGQTTLIVLSCAAMFFLAGLPILFILLLGLIAVGSGLGAYFSLSHVKERIDAFWTGEGDTFQVDVGREAILHGGWFGQGPGEGTIKRIIPDAHTDFVFSVAAEEYGIILCLIMVALFAFIVLRILWLACQRGGQAVGLGGDIFANLSMAGLAILFGLQAIINMAVNLHLVPPKGMTLPFISYGGSSLMAIGVTMGLLLALTRKRARTRITPVLDPAGVRI